MSITTKIRVSGMTCSSCTNSITSAIQKMEGVNSVSVSLLTEEAVINHNSKVSKESLLELIEDMGFDGQIVSSDSHMEENTPINSANSIDSFKTIIQVGGMTCSSCSNSIKNSLLSMDGVQSADVSLITEEATIVHSPSIKAQELSEAIEDIGFESTLLSSNSISVKEEQCKTELSITGMTCTSCVNSITKGLENINGINEVSISLMTEKAIVIHNSSVNPDIIRAEIEDLGFEASVLNVEEFKVKPESSLDVISSTLKIYGMTCSSCANTIEQALLSLTGVVDCSISLSLEEARIDYDSNAIGIRTILNEIQDCGFDALLLNKLDSTSQIDLLSKVKEINHWKQNFFKLLMVGVPVFFLGNALPLIKRKCHLNSDFLKVCRGVYVDVIIQFLLGSYIQFWLGKKFYTNAYKSLSHGSGSMDVLISVSTTIIYFYSTFSIFHSVFLDTYPNVLYDTSTMLFIFVSLGKWVESKAKGNTSTALSKLLALTPSSCIIIENPELFIKESMKEKNMTLDSSLLSQKEISVDLLQKNDIVVVPAGAKFPADGVCVFGSSEADESLLTGESCPVKKEIGAKLIGGSVNVASILYMKITTIGDKTQLQQIVKLVKDAQMSNAPVQRFADSIASIFVPCILGLSLLTLIFWSIWVFIAKPDSIPKLFINRATGSIQYFKILQVAISVVVVACPCALGLAAPTAVMVGTGVGAKNGILIKNGESLEKASSIDTVIFDKTGTLTKGVMELADHKFYGVYTDKERFVWSLIHAIESNSEHPISNALMKGAEKLFPVDGFETFKFDYVDTHAGLGVSATCTNETEDQFDIKLGNIKFMKSFEISNREDLEMAIQSNKASNKICSICHILINGTYVGYAEVADSIKPESKNVIEVFINSGYSVGMVTGDSVETSKHVAGLLGIPLNNVLAEASPEQKWSYLSSLQDKGLSVAFIGDGINDAPALVQADIGIAISSGTDIAMSAADIVLLSSTEGAEEKSHLGLMATFAALDISTFTFNTIKLNFLLAIVYNMIMLPISMGLLIIPFNVTMHPMFASAAMACSSTSVILNSLRLKNWSINKLQKKISHSNENKYNMGWNDGIADTRNEINELSTDSFIVNSEFRVKRIPILVRAYEKFISLFRRRTESYQEI